MNRPGGAGVRQKSIVRPPAGSNALVISPDDILKGKKGLALVEEKRESAKRTSQLKIPAAFLQGNNNNAPKTAPKPEPKPKFPGKDVLKPPDRPPKHSPVNGNRNPEPIKKEEPKSPHFLKNTSGTNNRTSIEPPVVKKTPIKPPIPSPTNTNISNGKTYSGGGKKYVLKQLPTGLGPAPKKPAKPPNVAATKLLGRLPSLPPTNVKLGRLPSLPPQGDDFDEVYDDVEATPAGGAKSPKRVSSIAPMSADDEREMDGIDSDDDPDAVYDSIGMENERPELPSSRIQEPADDEQEVYECFDDVNNDIVEQQQKEEKSKKEQERLEKEEAKRKEKEFKKEQKRKKEEEKEHKELKAKLKLTGSETVINSGHMKEDTRGGKYDLVMKKGDKIFILRMDNNPAGKWLCKNKEDKMGYVDSKSVEVDTGSIRKVMQKAKSAVVEDDDVYADAEAEEEDVYEDIRM